MRQMLISRGKKSKKKDDSLCKNRTRFGKFQTSAARRDAAAFRDSRRNFWPRFYGRFCFSLSLSLTRGNVTRASIFLSNHYATTSTIPSNRVLAFAGRPFRSMMIHYDLLRWHYRLRTRKDAFGNVFRAKSFIEPVFKNNCIDYVDIALAARFNGRRPEQRTRTERAHWPRSGHVLTSPAPTPQNVSVCGSRMTSRLRVRVV